VNETFITATTSTEPILPEPTGPFARIRVFNPVEHKGLIIQKSGACYRRDAKGGLRRVPGADALKELRA
jgi:hypothetical protein